MRPSLPPRRSGYLVFKRSHLTVVNTATEGKRKQNGACFLLCLLSGLLSSGGEEEEEEKKKTPAFFGNELRVMLKAKASQRSKIKQRE